ncbi:SDR family NAD(P)-dependent oxidoreductase [Hymenobacter psychrophilus]|uniref:NADP-dependent 3-hydroxy acid dehydrogenase YdfG n=1 Tax=Hymenobacter psychrophilus TaxID=651662 RepID=A0A1H3B7F0_9BACT|nr:SDR family NAD(P)-dependent oxidoreductase [Hymenobacter psychrophilus]SDX37877.1 NADP-dependent 3-hydroxy acid dehydrogenase YdfG [Hymenobacter psychrophilus]
MAEPSKSVVITGVSSGVGLAAARAFLARGYRVFGSIRRDADAEQLRAELGPNFMPLLFDVTDAEAVARAATDVAHALGTRPLTGLLNNAGIAFGGPLQHQPLDVIRQHFEVNVLGLIQVTQAFLPLLGARAGFAGHPGRVLNMGSVSGQVASPFLGAYVGSKHALEGVTATWRRELGLFGIPVVLIGLGVTQTPIWDKGIDLGPYAHTPYHGPARRFLGFINKTRSQGLTPEYVAGRLVQIMETPRPKLRYTIAADVFRAYIVPRLLPARALDWLLARGLGLKAS